VLHQRVEQPEFEWGERHFWHSTGARLRLIIVIQNTRQLRIQRTATKFTSRSALRGLDSSALQPDRKQEEGCRADARSKEGVKKRRNSKGAGTQIHDLYRIAIS
jgi:hypothetical protein